MDDALRAALDAASILDEMGVRWFLGGSLASSVHGIPRATFDADIMADLRPQHVKPFLKRLGDAWYADEGAITQALQARSSFNLIHFATAMKVGVFSRSCADSTAGSLPERAECRWWREAMWRPLFVAPKIS
jgi:hypothetical protein